ncbi:MAG: adenylyl-sulfate kinase, partial [Candidatus Omnitrophica bacterium]|nr:adenylyl-sulfate kinase [Candidatus Omnitrophota bacterium]
LVGYRKDVIEYIKTKYLKFLDEIKVKPKHFIPISAREGDNMVISSKKLPWYQGASILEALDDFKKTAAKSEQEFRFPIQDVYKFTGEEDDRRIFSGRVESGSIQVGDDVIFYPSRKESKISSVEGFNLPPQNEAFAGQSTGFCLKTQIYIRPGEIMCKKKDRSPHVSTKFKGNIFWMGRQPLVQNKTYKLKLATQHVPVVLSQVLGVLDASELASIANKSIVDRHDVAECIFETLKPIAFDEVAHIPETGRFVIIDNYEIAGGGIVLAPVYEEVTSLKEHIHRREKAWVRSEINPEKRAKKYQHKSALLVLAGPVDTGKQAIAKALEEELFHRGKFAYFLGVANEILAGGAAASNDKTLNKFQQIQQLGEMSHILTDAGLILITSVSDIDEYELQALKVLNHPHKTLVINVGGSELFKEQSDLNLPANTDPQEAVEKIIVLLNKWIMLDPEYAI